MKVGTTLWYVHGNYEKTAAIKLAEEGTKLLNLMPIDVKDLARIRTIQLP